MRRRGGEAVMTGLRAILVSVDYADLLGVTLPYNRHHFSDVMVVTAPRDEATLAVAVANRCRTHVTEAFYADGAVFNKWAALEEALDAYGRYGWLCLMDADVLWPKNVVVNVQYETIRWEVPETPTFYQDRGQLCSPLRRMLDGTAAMAQIDCGLVPSEDQWRRYPIHRNIGEWAGYSQIFHASDPVLGLPPWHETNFISAGTADSFFQRKWKPENKVRPPWECLHLGPAGCNWMGRVSRYLDGTLPEGADERLLKLRKMIAMRRLDRSDPFKHERIRRA